MSPKWDTKSQHCSLVALGDTGGHWRTLRDTGGHWMTLEDTG